MPLRELEWDDEAGSNAEAIQKLEAAADAFRYLKPGEDFYTRLKKLLEGIEENAERFAPHPHRCAVDGRKALIDGYLIIFDIESPTKVFINQMLHHRQNR